MQSVVQGATEQAVGLVVSVELPSEIAQAIPFDDQTLQPCDLTSCSNLLTRTLTTAAGGPSGLRALITFRGKKCQCAALPRTNPACPYSGTRARPLSEIPATTLADSTTPERRTSLTSTRTRARGVWVAVVLKSVSVDRVGVSCGQGMATWPARARGLSMVRTNVTVIRAILYRHGARARFHAQRQATGRRER